VKTATTRRVLRFLCIVLCASCVLAPNAGLACACGCSVFDVGAGMMMPVNFESGFSLWFRYSTMNQGLSLGVKLPTGDYTGPNGPLGGSEFDRDTLPGTGSTDVVLGAYHVGGINADDSLALFVQARYQFAFLTRNDYRPGNDLNGALGLTWSFGARGSHTRVTPVLQLIGSYRERDSGAASDPDNSGYKRLLLAPGVEARVGKARLYADVEFPVYQFTNAAPSGSDKSGQLVASTFLKAQISYDF
jgi:hypothetical protein